jgi:hypothetical protein
MICMKKCYIIIEFTVRCKSICLIVEVEDAICIFPKCGTKSICIRGLWNGPTRWYELLSALQQHGTACASLCSNAVTPTCGVTVCLHVCTGCSTHGCVQFALYVVVAANSVICRAAGSIAIVRSKKEAFRASCM